MQRLKLKTKQSEAPLVLLTIFQCLYKQYSKYKNGDIIKKEFWRLRELSYPKKYKYLSVLED